MFPLCQHKSRFRLTHPAVSLKLKGLKGPHRSHIASLTLGVVVELAAIVEVLQPGVAAADLRGTPIPGILPTNNRAVEVQLMQLQPGRQEPVTVATKGQVVAEIGCAGGTPCLAHDGCRIPLAVPNCIAHTHKVCCRVRDIAPRDARDLVARCCLQVAPAPKP